MSDDFRRPVYAAGRLELSFWSDVGKGISESVDGLKSAKIPALIVIALCLVDALGAKIPFIGLMEEVAVLMISYGMIRKIWCGLNAQNPAFTMAEFRGVETKMVGVTFLYGIYCGLYGLLLIAGGIWWGVRNCLALIVAAVEDLKPPECFKRSVALVEGHYWRAFRYAFGGPLILFIAVMLLGGVLEAATMLLPKSQEPGADKAIMFVIEVIGSFWQLIVITLLVRLYAYLKWEKDVAATDPINKGFKPSEPHWEK
jgi:hypothetical protein